MLQRGINFQSLGKQSFKNSALSHHIQVADIIAYNVYRQFVEYGEAWEDSINKELPTYAWLEKLSHKFRNNDGRIQGFGIIKMPIINRIKWAIK